MLILANITKAAISALKEYITFMGAMTTTEAMNILNISVEQELSHSIIKQNAEILTKKNKKALPASLYILKKIKSAETVLLREIE
ncbi:hypothetical protein NEIG_00129 [Nematocida sp. ERTm5]|nr:hypothetical protein NEIG_00129 [Nematocida sp. ERTm5]